MSKALSARPGEIPKGGTHAPISRFRPRRPLETAVADRAGLPAQRPAGAGVHGSVGRNGLFHAAGGQFHGGQRAGQPAHAAARPAAAPSGGRRRPHLAAAQPVDLRHRHLFVQRGERPVHLAARRVCRQDGRGRLPPPAQRPLPQPHRRALCVAQGQPDRRPGAAVHLGRRNAAPLYPDAAGADRAHGGDGGHRHLHHAAAQRAAHRGGRLPFAVFDRVFVLLFPRRPKPVHLGRRGGRPPHHRAAGEPHRRAGGARLCAPEAAAGQLHPPQPGIPRHRPAPERPDGRLLGRVGHHRLSADRAGAAGGRAAGGAGDGHGGHRAAVHQLCRHAHLPDAPAGARAGRPGEGRRIAGPPVRDPERPRRDRAGARAHAAGGGEGGVPPRGLLLRRRPPRPAGHQLHRAAGADGGHSGQHRRGQIHAGAAAAAALPSHRRADFAGRHRHPRHPRRPSAPQRGHRAAGAVFVQPHDRGKYLAGTPGRGRG